MTEPNVERDVKMLLLVEVPFFGRESQEPAHVEQVERIIQTGMHGRARVLHLITAPRGAVIDVDAGVRRQDGEGAPTHSNGQAPDLSTRRSRLLRWLSSSSGPLSGRN